MLFTICPEPWTARFTHVNSKQPTSFPKAHRFFNHLIKNVVELLAPDTPALYNKKSDFKGFKLAVLHRSFTDT